uniref:Uncharacterized protein n=1 Tax=Cacopsylla melanoneura TaxID=428564 RepID=A0A8D8VHE2_9HEMI
MSILLTCSLCLFPTLSSSMFSRTSILFPFLLTISLILRWYPLSPFFPTLISSTLFPVFLLVSSWAFLSFTVFDRFSLTSCEFSALLFRSAFPFFSLRLLLS